MALGGQPVHSTVVIRYLMLDDPVVLQVSQGVRQRTAVYRLSASNGEEVDQLAVTACARGQRPGRLQRPPRPHKAHARPRSGSLPQPHPPPPLTPSQVPLSTPETIPIPAP